MQSAAASVRQLFEVMLGKHATSHWYSQYPTWRRCPRLWPVINRDTGYTATYGGGVLLMLVHAHLSPPLIHLVGCLSCLCIGHNGYMDISPFHPMYSASVTIVLTCLSFTPLGPDHSWCASGNALIYHCACVSTWWNTVLCHQPSYYPCCCCSLFLPPPPLFLLSSQPPLLLVLLSLQPLLLSLPATVSVVSLMTPVAAAPVIAAPPCLPVPVAFGRRPGLCSMFLCFLCFVSCSICAFEGSSLVGSKGSC